MNGNGKKHLTTISELAANGMHYVGKLNELDVYRIRETLECFLHHASEGSKPIVMVGANLDAPSGERIRPEFIFSIGLGALERGLAEVESLDSSNAVVYIVDSAKYRGTS